MYLFIHRQRPPPFPVLSKSESFMEFHIQLRPPFIKNAQDRLKQIQNQKQNEEELPYEKEHQ